MSAAVGRLQKHSVFAGLSPRAHTHTRAYCAFMEQLCGRLAPQWHVVVPNKGELSATEQDPVRWLSLGRGSRLFKDELMTENDVIRKKTRTYVITTNELLYVQNQTVK